MKASAFQRSSYLNAATTRRSFMALAGGGVALAAGIKVGVARRQEFFDGGTAINSTDAEFTGGTYAVDAGGTLYQYARDTDGAAYYNTYDGSDWAGWEAYEDQPAAISYDPAPAVYDGKAQAYYTGDDGYLYEQSWDSYGDPQWQDVSGDYTFEAAPYATTWQESVYLFGTSTDGYVYHKAYTDGSWSGWEPLNDSDAPAKTDAKPYSVSWGDLENTFWLGDDGYAYWNRYSYADGSWAGARQIPSDWTHIATPVAVGYAPEQKLYAYSVSDTGAPVYNTFVDGDGWSGWEVQDASWTSSVQPSAYVYDDKQHVVYVADGGNAYYTYYAEDGWWGEWADLGDNYGYDAYQYTYEDDLYLTYTGENGAIYYKTYSGGEEEDSGY